MRGDANSRAVHTCIELRQHYIYLTDLLRQREERRCKEEETQWSWTVRELGWLIIRTITTSIHSPHTHPIQCKEADHGCWGNVTYDDKHANARTKEYTDVADLHQELPLGAK